MNNFPLIEDGIIGLPFLKLHRYTITNDKLQIDNDIPLQITKEEIPPQLFRYFVLELEMKFYGFATSILLSKTSPL